MKIYSDKNNDNSGGTNMSAFTNVATTLFKNSTDPKVSALKTLIDNIIDCHDESIIEICVNGRALWSKNTLGHFAEVIAISKDNNLSSDFDDTVCDVEEQKYDIPDFHLTLSVDFDNCERGKNDICLWHR